MVYPASTRALVNRFGDGIAACVGDRPNRHPLHVMAPLNRPDRVHLLERRRSVDRGRLRSRRWLLRMPIGLRRLVGRGLHAGARRDRLLLIQPPTKFGLLIAETDLPLGELGFPLAQLGFLLAQLGFPVGNLGFVLLKQAFPLEDLSFPKPELGYLLGKRGSPLGHLGLPLGELGFLLAELDFMLAHMPAQHGFPLNEPGFPFGKQGCPFGKHFVPLLQPAAPFAELFVEIAELGVFRDVSGQLLLDEVDEKIDFLLAITTLADSRPRERDIVDISRSESHCSSPVSDVKGEPK